MTQRMNIYKAAPQVYKAALAFSQAAGQGLDEKLKHLVELRASQINRCAFCLDMHTKDALHHGEDPVRISLVPAFDEAEEHFTDRERAALALTEAITVVTDGFVPDEVYNRAAEHFDEQELAALIASITAINMWNRLNVSTRTPGGHYKPGQY
ncbi:carboxymuconolactone decarboxylase family protein [Streptomyces sp. NPDC051940]|uniref:carboxymuconolactone decarboxylase family protein n=1 Tax=Streptomyces sp. NPDC051940 TaxID=3155675 RepID=UPI00341C7B60